MKIKMLKSTNCDGKRVKAGDVVDASDRQGRLLVNFKFAEVYSEPVKRPGRPKKVEAPVNRMDEADEGRGD
jgi:hypothetical protein